MAVSFSYSFEVLDKHLQMHFLFGHLMCASMPHGWRHLSPPCRWTPELCVMGHMPCLAAFAQGELMSLPHLLLLWHINAAASKMLPHPVTPLQQWTTQLYCKGIQLLPPTANLPLHLDVVLMINENNYIWVKSQGWFHSFSLWICNQNKRCSPKAHPQALSASFLQERADCRGGINISIHGVHFNTVSICQAKYCKTNKTLTAALKTSSCAQSLGWSWMGFGFFGFYLFILE